METFIQLCRTLRKAGKPYFEYEIVKLALEEKELQKRIAKEYTFPDYLNFQD